MVAGLENGGQSLRRGALAGACVWAGRESSSRILVQPVVYRRGCAVLHLGVL